MLDAFSVSYLGRVARYTISYTLRNPSDGPIPAGSFKLYYAGGGGGRQYEFDGNLLPGETLSRSHTFDVLDLDVGDVLAYPGEFFADRPSSDDLRWRIADQGFAPAPTATPTGGVALLPDLVPYRPEDWSAPLVVNGPLIAGESVTVDFAFTNIFPVEVYHSFEVAIVVDGVPHFRLRLPELAVGVHYQRMGVPIIVSEPGTHIVELVIDPENEVAEMGGEAVGDANNSYSVAHVWR